MARESDSEFWRRPFSRISLEWMEDKSGVVALSIRDTYMSCNILGDAYFVRTGAFISSF